MERRFVDWQMRSLSKEAGMMINLGGARTSGLRKSLNTSRFKYITIMPEVIECVYEDGVLKPFEKLNLKENTRVRVILKESVVEKTFGILKVSKDEIEEAFKELEDEWGFC